MSWLVARRETKPSAAWRAGKRTVLHAAESVGGTTRLCVVESWNDHGVGAPTHHHPDGLEELVIVLEGEAAFWVDGVGISVHKGDTIVLPPHSSHGFRNVGDRPLRVLGVFSAAAPKTVYEAHPDEVVAIGALGSGRIDTTRISLPRGSG